MNYREQLMEQTKANPFSSASTLVYEILLRSIINGDLPCGTPIKQSQLSEEFGLSRTPVRDAVNALIEEGYIEKVEPAGLRVYILNPRDYTELLQFRMQLETLAVQLASLSITRADLAALEAYQAMLKEASENNDVERALMADEQFHLTLIQACRNDYVIHAYMEVLEKICFYRRIISSKQNWYSTYRLHQNILEAIIQRNADEGVKLMRKHLTISKDVAAMFQ